MVEFTTRILQFDEQGEKTGWSYVEVPAELANAMKPGNRKSFRVKGFLDDTAVEGLSLLPMGQGNFILALNATIRKKIHKGKGAMLRLRLEPDTKVRVVPAWMIECLEDEPAARDYFFKLPKSHQDYYIRWIESAKTEATRTKRIALAVTAFARKLSYGEMMRYNREQENGR